MSNESTETIVTSTETTTETTVEANPHEEQAREQGWVAKDEWVASGRTESEWRPAKEFVERGEIFKSLHQVKRELKAEKAAREALQRHQQYMYDKTYARVMEDLKKEKRAAMRDEDFQKLEEVEDKIEKTQQERAAELRTIQAQQQAAAAQGIHPEFQAWVDRNPWYATDTDMREFAEFAGDQYIRKNPGSNPQDVLKHVENKVRKQFSEKFGKRTAAPNAVAGVDRTSQRSPGSSELVLDETELSIMKTLVANGDMTEKEYREQLKLAKGIK